jgi:hypothetical protein
MFEAWTNFWNFINTLLLAGNRATEASIAKLEQELAPSLSTTDNKNKTPAKRQPRQPRK